MKNIQVIDGAANCTFSLFQATEEEFQLLFPQPLQDIQYAEALFALPNHSEIEAALNRIWERPIRKQDAQGIHGTLFYQLQRYKEWYPRKSRRSGRVFGDQRQRSGACSPCRATDRSRGASSPAEAPSTPCYRAARPAEAKHPFQPRAMKSSLLQKTLIGTKSLVKLKPGAGQHLAKEHGFRNRRIAPRQPIHPWPNPERGSPDVHLFGCQRHHVTLFSCVSRPDRKSGCRTP
jgi:hypothetical protein